VSSTVIKANVLVIDDSETIRKKIRNTLESAGLTEFCFEAKSGLDGFKLLLEKKVDLVICDLVMPEFDGFKFLISRATRRELAEIPVIILTSEEDTATKIKGLEHGAADYVLKPFDEGELLARVKVHLRLKFLQDALKERNAQLLELSGTDELTQLYNRRRFMEYFVREFSRARRYKYALSLVIFDIDFFKSVNDQFGHLVGDSLLAEMASVMQNSMRMSDMLGRYGGEEFTMLLPHTALNEAVHTAQRIRKKVEVTSFSSSTNEVLKVTLSGGVASYPEIPVDSVDDLIRKADEALYQAKAKGRNRIERAG
jgi:two-component system cell cycle response regulator